MRWMWMLLLLVFCAGAVASEMWRWVDANGVVHYSDRPRPGAERVEVGAAQTFSAPVIAPSRRDEPATEGEPAPLYSRLGIVSPAEGETLWNIGGELSVQVAVEPRLASGHQLRIFLDGSQVEGVPQGATQFTIGEVFRGERRLRASIVDARGRELVSSETITFYVQQTSVLNPNRPRPGGG
jgi:hypothetical protein